MARKRLLEPVLDDLLGSFEWRGVDFSYLT